MYSLVEYDCRFLFSMGNWQGARNRGAVAKQEREIGANNKHLFVRACRRDAFSLRLTFIGLLSTNPLHTITLPTMAKRQHQAEADDDESLPRASPKRARTADSDEEPPRNRRRDANGRNSGRSQRSQKAAAAQSDEEEELREEDVASQNVNGDMDMDDEEFDQRYGEPLRAHMTEMRKHATPGVSQCLSFIIRSLISGT